MNAAPATPMIACDAGVVRTNGATVLWVKSPRTGNVAKIPKEHWSKLPERLVGRIVQACARGAKQVEMTHEELRTIANTIPQQPKSPPAPALAPTKPQLPEIHPGTPEGMRVTLSVVVAVETAKALKIEVPGCPGKSVWVPRAKVDVSQQSLPFVHHRVGKNVSMQPRRIAIPVWLYKRVKAEFEELNR